MLDQRVVLDVPDLVHHPYQSADKQEIHAVIRDVVHDFQANEVLIGETDEGPSVLNLHVEKGTQADAGLSDWRQRVEKGQEETHEADDESRGQIKRHFFEQVVFC